MKDRPDLHPDIVSPEAATMQMFSEFPALSPPRGLRLTQLPDRPCPYLPDRLATDRAIWAEGISADLYEQFMNRGFRRSGKLLYQPVCRGCRQCRSIRVPVGTFSPDKSQRRCLRRNNDLTVRIGTPSLTDEKFELYQRYVCQWHGGSDSEDSAGLESFLYCSPLTTSLEFEYRDTQSRLIGIGICDKCPAALSSVYFYFEPSEANRSLGTFSAMSEIEFAKKSGESYYYLGYWVQGCGSMDYKQRFQPCEILDPDGQWRPLLLQGRTCDALDSEPKI